MITDPFATAVRLVSGFSPTSTMRATPESSTWDSPGSSSLPPPIASFRPLREPLVPRCFASITARRSASWFSGSPAWPLTQFQLTRRVAAASSSLSQRSRFLLRFHPRVRLSLNTATSDDGGTASRPAIAASISIRLLVVRSSPPLTLSSFPSETMTAAHPPGPGLPEHAPSVYILIMWTVRGLGCAAIVPHGFAGPTVAADSSRRSNGTVEK